MPVENVRVLVELERMPKYINAPSQLLPPLKKIHFSKVFLENYLIEMAKLPPFWA